MERSMGTDEYKKKLEIMSIEERETIDVLNKISFYRKYMDLLVISKQLELITDIVFLRTSCPCILQPDSVVIKMWNYINAILALALVIIYPYCSSFDPILRVSISHPFTIFSTVSIFKERASKSFPSKKQKNSKYKNKGFQGWYFVLIGIITIIWIFDIYISISTAIKTKDTIIANVWSIFLRKARSIYFIMDVMAAVPLELIAVAIADVDIQKVMLLQMNRLFKVKQTGSFLFHNQFLSPGNICLKFHRRIHNYIQEAR